MKKTKRGPSFIKRRVESSRQPTVKIWWF